MPTERKPTVFPPGVKLRLSRRGTRPKTGSMERFLRRLGVSGTAYRRWTGGQSLKDFHSANPAWTQRAWEVLILENLSTLRAKP